MHEYKCADTQIQLFSKTCTHAQLKRFIDPLHSAGLLQEGAA